MYGNALVLSTQTFDWLFYANPNEIDEAVDVIADMKERLDENDVATIREIVPKNLDKIGSGVHVFWRDNQASTKPDLLLEDIRKQIKAGNKTEILGAINLFEFLHPDQIIPLQDVLWESPNLA